MFSQGYMAITEQLQGFPQRLWPGEQNKLQFNLSFGQYPWSNKETAMIIYQTNKQHK